MKFVLGVLVGHPLVPAQFRERFQDLILVNAMNLKKTFQRRTAFFEQAQQQMFGADIIVLEFPGLLFGGIETFLQRGTQKDIG